MLRISPRDFNSACSRSSSSLPKCPLKRYFLDIYFITFFGVRNFRNTSAMRAFFFWKTFKVWSRLQKCKNKNWHQFSCFWDNCLWIGCVKVFVLRKEYFPRVVNALANTFQILHISKRDFSNPIAFTVINNYAKGGVAQISTVLGRVHHAARRSVLWNGIF